MIRRGIGLAVVIVALLGAGLASGLVPFPAGTAARTAPTPGGTLPPGFSPVPPGSFPTTIGSPATAGPQASSSATPGRIAGAAPTGPRGFKLRGTIVPIGFPLPASASYRYGPGWHAPRLGAPLPYESILGISSTGRLLRAHDGVDLQVAIGTPVLAAFSGVVIDPRTRWYPWAPQLYGNVVVIRSTEPTSRGYYAINAHLSIVDVHVGEVVRRGEIVGRTGITGNAKGTIPHLHFELRAPFMIDQVWGGVFRRIDSFDARPSLLAADPHRRSLP